MLYIYYASHHGKIKNKKIISRVIYITHVLNSRYGTLYIHLSFIKWIDYFDFIQQKNYFDLCPTSPIAILCCCVKGKWVKELKMETATEDLNNSIKERFRGPSLLKFQKKCKECIYPIWENARAGMN